MHIHLQQDGSHTPCQIMQRDHSFGVPLGTVLCPSGHSYNLFADDSQFHYSSVPSDFSAFACSLKNCIGDVAEWMSDSKLKMNNDTAELIAIQS